jgi:hypothetical protein
MGNELNEHQATETVPSTASATSTPPTAEPDSTVKAKKKKEAKIFPTKLNSIGKPDSQSAENEFSGRIEKTSIRDIAPGRRQIAFSITGKKGNNRPYLIEVSEAAADIAMVNLLMAVFAAKRKVKVTTAPHTDGSLRVTEVEVRK